LNPLVPDDCSGIAYNGRCYFNRSDKATGTPEAVTPEKQDDSASPSRTLG